MNCDVGEATEWLENELWCRWSDGKVGEWAELILQTFPHFTYVTTHSLTLPSLYLHNSSFSNPSVDSPTLQFILQPFFRFSYVTSSSLNSPGEPPMIPLYELCSFSKLSLTSPTSQLILQPFRRFTYVSSFSNPSVASPTLQFILQPFFRFSYVTSSSINSPGEPLMITRWILLWQKFSRFFFLRLYPSAMSKYNPAERWNFPKWQV